MMTTAGACYVGRCVRRRARFTGVLKYQKIRRDHMTLTRRMMLWDGNRPIGRHFEKFDAWKFFASRNKEAILFCFGSDTVTYSSNGQHFWRGAFRLRLKSALRHSWRTHSLGRCSVLSVICSWLAPFLQGTSN